MKSLLSCILILGIISCDNTPSSVEIISREHIVSMKPIEVSFNHYEETMVITDKHTFTIASSPPFVNNGEEVLIVRLNHRTLALDIPSADRYYLIVP